MQDVADLHHKAMGLADEAMLARLRGETDQAADLTRRALEHEEKAALLLRDQFDAEPTRSVLFRSAATLALDCGHPREAERLIGAALAGNPPEEIAGELRDLLEQVYFNRHLDLRGIVLASAEFQVSLVGDSVGFGMAPSDELVTRVKDTESLIYRTAERKRARPFREQGRRKKDLQDELELFVSVPRAASFAVTFRIGTQGVLPGIGLADTLIDEILDCLDLLNRGDERSLHDKIVDDAYYRNFVSLGRKIAPDGRDIRAVGFTSIRPAGERRVVLSTARPNLLKPPPPPMAFAFVRANRAALSTAA